LCGTSFDAGQFFNSRTGFVDTLRRALGEFVVNRIAVCIEFAFVFMFFVLIDGLESAVLIGMKTGTNGFWITVKELGDSGGGFSGVMQGEGVHPHHDVRLRMVKAIMKNGGKVVGRNRNAEHNEFIKGKPPSSDIVKLPKQQDRRRKRKPGAQKGHQQHLRSHFPPEQVDTTIELKLDTCPKCGSTLTPTNDPPKKHQQVELVEKPFIVTEYQQTQ
jgi:hypothetical protein